MKTNTNRVQHLGSPLKDSKIQGVPLFYSNLNNIPTVFMAFVYLKDFLVLSKSRNWKKGKTHLKIHSILVITANPLPQYNKHKSKILCSDI